MTFHFYILTCTTNSYKILLSDFQSLEEDPTLEDAVEAVEAETSAAAAGGPGSRMSRGSATAMASLLSSPLLFPLTPAAGKTQFYPQLKQPDDMLQGKKCPPPRQIRRTHRFNFNFNFYRQISTLSNL